MSRIITNNLRHNDASADNINLDGNARVGIGTSSPTRPLTVAAASGASVNILGVFDARSADSGTVGNCVIAFSDPTSTAGQFATRLGSVGDSLAFYTNGSSERMRILSGGGITFNGDTAAANALDDYEEGTFTPVLKFGGGTTGITYGVQLGRYTRIGRLVTASFTIRLTNKGSSTSYATVSLPFTSDEYAMPNLPGYAGGTGYGNIASVGFIAGHIGAAGYLYNTTTNAYLTDASFSNTSDIVMTVSYNTST